MVRSRRLKTTEREHGVIVRVSTMIMLVRSDDSGDEQQDDGDGNRGERMLGSGDQLVDGYTRQDEPEPATDEHG